MKTHTFFATIASHEVFVEFPSLTRGPTFLHIATHKSDPALVSPGSTLLWVGRLHFVLSRAVTSGAPASTA